MKKRYARMALPILAGMAALAGLTATAGAARAADKYWVDPASDYWLYDSNWSLSEGGTGGAGQPQYGEAAYLVQSGATNKTAWYYTSYPDAVLSSLIINATGTGTMTLHQGYNGYAHPFAATDEYIGTTGTGVHIQSRGINSISNFLILGEYSGGSGTYGLSDTGSLSASTEYIGYSGTGTFTQSGGTNSVSSILYLGLSSGGSGTYSLSAGSLSAYSERVGYNGTGTFTHSGGTNSSDYLTLGYSGSGTYDLSGTGSLSAKSEIIGDYGTGTLTQAGGTNSITSSLNLGHSSGSSGQYNLSAGSLSASTEVIGRNGNGTFNQTGGTNTLSTLYLGFSSGTSGSYALSGDGSLSSTFEYVGYNGNGTFNQTGGTNSISNDLFLGYLSGAAGSYSLSGGGSLSAAYEYVGYGGNGTFTQAGGTNTTTTLVVGANYNDTGTYDLKGSAKLAAASEIIGRNGLGVFNQSGGTNTITGTLALAHSAGSSGSAYNLSGGSLTAARIVNNGTLAQSNGSIDAVLENNGTFTYSGGTFSGKLLNNETVDFQADFTAGDGIVNNSTLMIGTYSVPDRLVTASGDGFENNGDTTVLGSLEANGTGLVNNGNLSLGNATSLLGGTGQLSNYGYLSAYDEATIGGSGGFVNQANMLANGDLNLTNTGANANYGTLSFPGSQLRLKNADLTNAGSLALDSSIVAGTGTLHNTAGGTISGSGIVNSGLENNGGRLLVAGSTRVSQAFNSSGTIQLTNNAASLTGGAIANTGTIQGLGQVANDIANTGTIEALGGTLSLAGAVTNNSGGLITAATGNKVLASKGLKVNDGVINLAGGTFDNNNQAMGNSNQISGYGILRTGGLTNKGAITITGGTITGGTTTVNGNVTNAGKIEVAYNPAIFTGDIINNGFFKTTAATVKFTGSYTENGRYLSDPSTQTFWEWTLGETAVVQGGLGDIFQVGSNFINHSLQSTDWDTDAATLVLNGFTQRMDLASADYGAFREGYIDNFAWGEFTIHSSVAALTIGDGNATEGAALYVGLFSLDGGLEQLTKIYSDYNIYYDPLIGGNSWLNGLTYALNGSGWLAPVGAVPVPGAVWLFGSGLLSLLGIRRRSGRW